MLLVAVSNLWKSYRSILTLYSSQIYPCPILFCIGSYPNAARSFFLNEEICTRIELLKLFTLPSHRCSIISSGLITRLRCSRKYSRSELSFRVRERCTVNVCLSCAGVKSDAPAFQADILLYKFPARKTSDTCFKLFEMERFGKVIICSHIQPFHFIHLVKIRRITVNQKGELIL